MRTLKGNYTSGMQISVSFNGVFYNYQFIAIQVVFDFALPIFMTKNKIKVCSIYVTKTHFGITFDVMSLQV